MKHLELHILQSFPVSCMNRDDLNSPKTAIFGGVQRARLSSQSWKRPIRELAAEAEQSLFAGIRTRLLIAEIKSELTSLSRDEQSATALASCLGHYLAKLDPKYAGKIKTMMFFSGQEIERMARLLHELPDKDAQKLIHAFGGIDASELESDPDHGDGHEEADADADDTPAEKSSRKGKQDAKKPPSGKAFGKAVASVLKVPVGKAFRGKDAVFAKDAADVALFGRMVAADHSLSVEAAAMFSHAISTNKVDANEIDFFSAVDDLQPTEEAGAGMTGTLEFNSATYYRFVGLNLDMLFDTKDGHLKALTPGERKSVVKAFVSATLQAYPKARQNSMHATTLPGFVLGIIRDKGHPIQLVNAFERPIRPFGPKGLHESSVDALLKEYQRINSAWGLDKNEKWKGAIVSSDYPLDKKDDESSTKTQVAGIPAQDLEAFLEELVRHAC